MDGTVCILDDVAGAGLDIVGIIRALFVPSTCKISIRITFEVGVIADIKNQAFVGGPKEVADNSLGCGVMSKAGVVAVLGTLVDGHGDVWASGGSQVVELSNQGPVVEGCSLWWDSWAGFTLVQDSRGRSALSLGLLIFETGGLDDLGDEVLLSDMDFPIPLNNLHPEVVLEWPLVFQDVGLGFGALHGLDEGVDGGVIRAESDNIIHINDQDEVAFEEHTGVNLGRSEVSVKETLLEVVMPGPSSILEAIDIFDKLQEPSAWFADGEAIRKAHEDIGFHVGLRVSQDKIDGTGFPTVNQGER